MEKRISGVIEFTIRLDMPDEQQQPQAQEHVHSAEGSVGAAGPTMSDPAGERLP